MRYLLQVLSLSVATWICKASEPPRSCIDTGPTCIDSCTGVSNGNYQWCGGCQWFVQCSGQIAYYQPCPEELRWNDGIKACVSVSGTCTECEVHTSPNGASGTGSTEKVTMPVEPLCKSTGPDCLTECDGTFSGVYQWCGRCDYFLDCSGSSSFYMECAANTLYDHTVRACVHDSTTCQQDPCYEDLNSATSPVNPCLSFPCQNGGTCTVNGNNFLCVCPQGYTGTFCEELINPCQSQPCLNGATCTVNGNNFLCVCQEGYFGVYCETYDPCPAEPCENGGTCTTEGNSFTCSCPQGYTGVYCETKLTCQPNPCWNGGTCVDPGAGPVYCQCPFDFTGFWCESENYNVNETCGDLMKSTPYSPAPGWTKLCEITKNDGVLVSTPCHNLLQALPVYENSAGLVQGGGNFGCWLSNDYPNGITQGCLDNYQTNRTLSECSSCTHFVVCLRYPY